MMIVLFNLIFGFLNLRLMGFVAIFGKAILS